MTSPPDPFERSRRTGLAGPTGLGALLGGYAAIGAAGAMRLSTLGGAELLTGLAYAAVFVAVGTAAGAVGARYAAGSKWLATRGAVVLGVVILPVAGLGAAHAVVEAIDPSTATRLTYSWGFLLACPVACCVFWVGPLGVAMLLPWALGAPIRGIAETPAHDRSDALALVGAPLLATIGAASTWMGAWSPMGWVHAGVALAGTAMVARSVARVLRRRRAVLRLAEGELPGWAIRPAGEVAGVEALLPLMRPLGGHALDGVLVRLPEGGPTYREGTAETPVALVPLDTAQLVRIADRRRTLTFAMTALHAAATAAILAAWWR